MPQSAAPEASASPEGIVIPDCCNIGVVFRTLVAVNAAAFAAIAAQAAELRQAAMEFVQASVVIELACLWSLFALCGARQLLRRARRRAMLPAWAQRAVTLLVTAVVTGAVMRLFAGSGLGSGSGAAEAIKGMLAGALAGALFQHYFELRSKAYSPVLTEARLQALQARIRPHFLFNSLNAVLSLIRSEPRRAETTLEDLAELFRVLMSDPRHLTTLEDEIRLCRQYLSIEKIRLGERLQVEWDTRHIGDEALRNAQVPVLLLQPLLENAVRYGVEPSPAPAPVQVMIARFMDKIEIVVVNTCSAGAVESEGNHMALSNIRERLALLYDVEAGLTTTAADGVFEVRLRFPYVKGTA